MSRYLCACGALLNPQAETWICANGHVYRFLERKEHGIVTAYDALGKLRFLTPDREPSGRLGIT